MSDTDLLARAATHLTTLTRFGDRHVGGEGNAAATTYFADVASSLGWMVALTPFECIDWEHGEGWLACDGARFAVSPGPYSPPADLSGTLVAVDTLDALRSVATRGCILLLHGEIAAGQMMPRDYPFYYPDEHRRFYETLDAIAPAAVLAATGRDPGLAGGAYPFPLIQDGAFGTPSAYLKDVDAPALLALDGTSVRLTLDSRRVDASATHVVATLPGTREGTVLVLAHIDSVAGSPGAIDNATGVVVLLLVAALLRELPDRPTVELWPINGEDHYAAFGERFMVDTYAGRTDTVRLGINIDGVGYTGSPSAVSCYGCHPEVTAVVDDLVGADGALVAGEPWYQGDQSVLMQMGIPAIAITSADMPAIWTTIAHTANDAADVVDLQTVVRTALLVAEMAARD